MKQLFKIFLYTFSLSIIFFSSCTKNKEVVSNPPPIVDATVVIFNGPEIIFNDLVWEWDSVGEWEWIYVHTTPDDVFRNPKSQFEISVKLDTSATWIKLTGTEKFKYSRNTNYANLTVYMEKPLDYNFIGRKVSIKIKLP